MFRHYRVHLQGACIHYLAKSRKYTYVTWRGNEYELPEEDMIVSKHVEA